MKKLQNDYVERVYAGWLGKVIGVRHGSNIEGWTFEKIRSVYGEMTTARYLFDFKNFAADDDTNGPLFFIRALEDYTHTRELTAEQIGLTWLNYAPYEHGFYWWGGYGKSTEHTAYLNLRNGIMAPRSGSVELNGAAVAEQIGGQIFIDTWGLISPGDYKLAAEFAEKAASVSHGGNGIYGGMFIAACISAAFEDSDIYNVIEKGLSVIPIDCDYMRMSRDLIRFYKEYPDNWLDCFRYVQQNYGYDKYPGACHIIPNSAVIVLSLLYGKGSFTDSINICNMCGWDTDCNVANVGTILGVLVGLDGIDMNWRRPINDLLICSSVIGGLNIADLANSSFYLAGLGYKVMGAEVPVRWLDTLSGKAATYGFELPHSTHAFRFAVNYEKNTDHLLEHTTETAHTGTGALKIAAKLHSPGDEAFVFVKTYYRPDDFNDSRYAPSFSPTLYPGQSLSAFVTAHKDSDCSMRACLYVKDGNSGRLYTSEPVDVTAGHWTELRFEIPALEYACLTEAGVKFIRGLGGNVLLAYVDDFNISGKPDYTLDFSRERMEVWHVLQREVSQFTTLKGIWDLENGKLMGSCADYAEAYTGDVSWRDYTVTVTLMPKIGENHRINFRVQGALRSYAVGLAPNGKLALYKNNNGYAVLADTDFNWEHGKQYILNVTIRGAAITAGINGSSHLRFIDNDSPYLTGQVGFSVVNGSRCAFERLTVKGL